MKRATASRYIPSTAPFSAYLFTAADQPQSQPKGQATHKDLAFGFWGPSK